MPQKKNKAKRKTKPAYTTCSCNLCLDLDCEDMVACDECDKWFHFECVGVTDVIKDKSWRCESCKKMVESASTQKANKSRNEMSSKKSSVSEPPPLKPLSLSSSKPNSMTSRQKAVALKKLEEEEKIKLDILERKFKIMECSDAEGVSDDDFVKEKDVGNASLEYTLHWAKNVQMISENRTKNARSDQISVSASDEERELLNKLYPPTIQSTLLEQTNHSKNRQDEQELAFIVEQFKKYRVQKSKLDQIEAELPGNPDLNTVTKAANLVGQHAQPSECQARKVKFDQASNVHQQQVSFGQNFAPRPESNIQQPIHFDSRPSGVQQPSMKIDSTNVQVVKNPSLNVGYGQTSNPNDQFPQTNYGFGTFGMTNNHQPPINNGFGSSNFAFNQRQPMSNDFNFSIDPNMNSQHQQTGFPYRTMNFGGRNDHQQQSSNFGLGASNFSNSQQVSGYYGYVGPLTANHIAARHTHSKDLPTFDGRAEQWPMFLSALINSTNSCGFSDGDNLGRLQRCLKGDALDTVQSRLMHATSVPGVVETLYLLFGRPNLIIHKLLEKINKTPPPKADDLNSVIKFAIAVQNLCATIESSRNLEYLRNPILMQSLTDKLPSQIQLNWAFFKHGAGNVDLSVLGNWLYQLAQVATEVINPSTVRIGDKKDKKDKENSSNTQSANYVNAQSENGDTNSLKKIKCRGCNLETNHKLENCKKFKELSIDDKWSFIKKHKVCGSCFGNHQYYKCTKKTKCGIDGCKYNHHVLLHNSKENKVAVPKTISDSKHESNHANSHQSLEPMSKLPDIFRIVPVTLSYGQKSIQIFAYLDDGSNLTSLDEKIARKLGAVGTVKSLCVLWSFGDREVLQDSRQLTIRINGVFDGAEEFSLNHVRTVKKLMLPTQSITKEWLEQYAYFDGIPISTYKNAKPQMIIGLEYSKLMVSLETIEGEWTQPIVCRTRLGWVVQGPNDESSRQDSPKNYGLNMCECQSSDNKTHQLVKEFFSIENFGVNVSDKVYESKEISRARKLLEETTIKKGNRYESALLWRYDNIELPDSLYMAKQRLDCVESKMRKDPALAERLRIYIADFVEKGYIRKLSSSEQQQKGARTWYLPIFPVFNPKKPAKLRVVWDAAAKVKGKSLNSMILVGPDQLVPLPDVLRRFRERQIGITGDIKEMFHQILVREVDQDSQRFLWRDGDSTREPDVYIMQVLTFGSSCSPCIAQFVKNKNAMDFKDEFPRAVEAITKSHYVDDMIESAHTVADAVQLVKEVQHIHQHAGFELRNFISNSQDVLQEINGSSQCGNKVLDDANIFVTERVLGMYWNTKSDTFTYSLKFVKANFNSENFIPTKREVLRTVMSVFDPMGFLAHFVVYAKILLQEIWRSSIGWDDQLPVPLKNKWILWLENLPKVENIHIPRLYSMRMSPEPANSIQLHLFVDASLEAYAAVAYFRIQNDFGVDSCLVGAKSKVAPNKPMSVPRLELQGGVLGTRLVESITKSHTGLKVDKTIIWCDSKTVLFWINSDFRKYSQFVAFRVGEIIESSNKIEWRWIPSEHNVADEATKSRKIADLNSSSRWFSGPEFLRDENPDWTFELDEANFQTDEELRPYYSLTHLEIPVNKFIEYERFSNWNRLLRAMAYVLRFVEYLKVKNEHEISELLTTDELLRAENTLYKQVQYDSFKEEILIIRWNETAPLNKQKEFDKTSIIRKWSPYIDDNGVMRVEGRTDAAISISEATRHPIILPRNHYVTYLIVYYYHQKYLHLHHQTVLNEISQKYWIPKLRVVLGVIRNNCQKCKNSAAVPRIPVMAPLPPARLAVYVRPFTYSGIDYFGPILVIVGRSTQKRWGVLITCLTTRAIHLEVAYSLNTSSCIMAIQNFIATRGQPKELYSDNGTNFHGSDNELREEFKKLDRNRIQEEFTTTQMSWSFNPPTASHMGGSWERMIRIVKKCLDESMLSRYPTDEVLTNLLKLTMNIVNSRPLTYVSLDSPTDEVLTPNHLLLGSSNGIKPPGDFTEKDLLKNTWKAAQMMADKFWNAFVLQYLPTLNQRQKWLKKVEPMKVDDIVLIVDENFKRNTWPKGIVVETFKDKIGQVRSAKVRTDLGTFLVRPVAKLIALDIKNRSSHNEDEVKELLNGGKDVVEQQHLLDI